MRTLIFANLEEEYAKRSVDLDASESEEEDDNYKFQPQNNDKTVTLAPSSTSEISEEMASKSVQSIGGIEDDAQIKPPTGSEAEKPNTDSNKKPEAEDFSGIFLNKSELANIKCFQKDLVPNCIKIVDNFICIWVLDML